MIDVYDLMFNLLLVIYNFYLDFGFCVLILEFECLCVFEFGVCFEFNFSIGRSFGVFYF